MDVSKRIKELREKAGYSNRQLGLKADIPQTIINRLERGVREADVPIIEKICAALNITLKEFFDVENEEALNLNPEYIKLINTVKVLPEDKLKILNDVAEGFKESIFKKNGDVLQIKQEIDAPDMPEEDKEKIYEFIKNKKEH